jgi:hypothetical protein
MTSAISEERLKLTIMKEEGIIYKGMENVFNFFDFIFGYTTPDNE